MKSLNGKLSSLVEEIVESGISLEQARSAFERQVIVAALRSHQGNVGASAKHLGIHRNTLRNKMSGHRISCSEYAQARSSRTSSGS